MAGHFRATCLEIHVQPVERLVIGTRLRQQRRSPSRSLARLPKRLYTPVGYRYNKPVMSKPTDLVQGTLDVLILKMLALQSMSGWGISQRLRALSAEALQVSHGSLYPALHKLERDGLITAEWRTSESNRRAKFYSLTRPGRKCLQLETDNWERLSHAITAVLRLREV